MKDSLEAVTKTEQAVQGALIGAQYSSYAMLGVYAALNKCTTGQALSIVKKWAELLPKLITKYHDGYRAENLYGEDINMKKLFYSKDWLDVSGYWDSPINSGDDVILFGPSPIAIDEYKTSYTTIAFSAILSCMATLLAVSYYIRSTKAVQRHDYITINL